MKGFSDFLSLLATIPDPRRAEGKLYKLPHVLLFSILAVAAGANSYRGIHTFIKVHRGRLNKAFNLKWRKPPSYSTIRFILQGLDVDAIEQAFRQHAGDLNDHGKACATRALALDGKTLRGSFDAFNDVRAKQVLSVFAADTALVLAHVEIDEKSNEIAAKSGVHLVVQLKANQAGLRRKVKAGVKNAKPLSGIQTVDQNKRNRHETRTVGVFDTAAKTIRQHWGIENKSHYVRDVTFKEDASRIRKNPGVIARIRSFAYNILRFNQADTIAQDRYALALGGIKALASMNYWSER